MEAVVYFPAMEFGNFMGVNRFEKILECIHFSRNPNEYQQILDLNDAVNKNAQASIIPGHILCFYESMIKAFYRNLYGKKNHEKFRPQGNELKTLCNSESMIVLNMELNESRATISWVSINIVHSLNALKKGSLGIGFCGDKN